MMDADSLLIALLSEHRATCDRGESCPTVLSVREARDEIKEYRHVLKAIDAQLKDSQERAIYPTSQVALEVEAALRRRV